MNMQSVKARDRNFGISGLQLAFTSTGYCKYYLVLLTYINIIKHWAIKLKTSTT